MKQACAVKWCAAVAVDGAYCSVHRLDNKLHPVACAENEVATDDTDLLDGAKCDECDGDGEVECSECCGDGECTCPSCDHEHDCGRCEGTGTEQCETCQGSGLALKQPEDGPVYVPLWATMTGTKPTKHGPVRWTPSNYVERRKRA